MSHPRDPEVARLAVESLRLVARAEKLHADLMEHQRSLADFLKRVDAVTKESSS